jgi:polysaccharide export outer membrane protein
MQTGGPGMFGRDAPPPWRTQIAMPALLKPGVRPVVQPVMVAQPIETMAMPEPVAQPVILEAADGSYQLDSGDKLRVVVFGQEGLSASYSVDTSGNITMPLIGAVRARGMSTAGLQQAVVAKLRNGYVREPYVAVEVEAYRPFFILGEVTLPGQYPYVPNMTVETAVAIAGGYTPRAFKRKIEISHQVNGLTERRVVSPNYPVRPGDTVHVSERWF